MAKKTAKKSAKKSVKKEEKPVEKCECKPDEKECECKPCKEKCECPKPCPCPKKEKKAAAGYTEEERTANLTYGYSSIPFLEDKTLKEGFPDYSEEFRPSDEKWDEYVEANRELVIPKLDEMIKEKNTKTRK